MCATSTQTEKYATHLVRPWPDYVWTKERTLTRRAVVWPGYLCNVRCVFCYNAGMKKSWRPFDGSGGLKEEIDRKRFQYHNQDVDFMGGEFTLHPEVLKVVEYCSRVGLRPTIITNALALADRRFTEKLKKAGVQDFLVSLHGIGGTADRIFNVDRKGLFDQQLQAMGNLKSLEIPFRTNTTLLTWNKNELTEIAGLAAEMGARVVNWINFNPHFAWAGADAIGFQERYANLARCLKPALHVCEQNGLETNVRYFPFCLLKGYEKHVYHCAQLPYDHHEWDYNSWYETEVAEPDRNYYSRMSLQRAHDNGTVKGPKCSDCALSKICDGFHSQYVRTHGFDEAEPYTDRPAIEESTHFIRDQWKIEACHVQQ